MKEIVVPGGELFNSSTNEFSYTEDVTLHLEHSLVTLSKWESKWHISFLTSEDKTQEQIIDYIKCMTIDKNIPSDVYERLSDKNIKDIQEYINDPMTATKVNHDNYANKNQPVNNVQITSEVIYYQMTALNIPVEFEHWHINRLLTLIDVCKVYNSPPKKLSKQEALARAESINEANKRKLGLKR